MDMDPDTRSSLAALLRRERIAHLATLRQEAPMASMTLYLPEEGFRGFLVHVSRLAWHTQDMAKDPRVALSVAQADDGRADPFTLKRISIRGEAVQIRNDSSESETLKPSWLARVPAQAINFELADFSFWRVVPRDARFIAGFGGIHNRSADDLAACSGC